MQLLAVQLQRAGATLTSPGAGAMLRMLHLRSYALSSGTCSRHIMGSVYGVIHNSDVPGSCHG